MQALRDNVMRLDNHLITHMSSTLYTNLGQKLNASVSRLHARADIISRKRECVSYQHVFRASAFATSKL